MRSFLLFFIAFLCCGFLCASQASAREGGIDGGIEASELWSGEIYTATYRAGACVKRNGELRGVLLLRTWTGDVDSYHFIGKVTGDRIEARHHSGHTFVGRYVSSSAVQGVIKLKSGRKIEVTGKRKLRAKVSDDCAPL